MLIGLNEVITYKHLTKSNKILNTYQINLSSFKSILLGKDNALVTVIKMIQNIHKTIIYYLSSVTIVD